MLKVLDQNWCALFHLFSLSSHPLPSLWLHWIMAAMAVNTNQTRDISPMFILYLNFPPDNNKPILCASCVLQPKKEVASFQCLENSQWEVCGDCIRKRKTRTQFLLEWLDVWRHTLTTHKNPFIVQSTDGKELPATKLIIGNIPLSYSNDEIEGKLGCKPRSEMLMERDRDEKGGLTRWLTGRRFLHIEIPSHRLPSQIHIGPCKATLPPPASLTSIAENVVSQATSEGTRPAHCLQYHLRTTPPRTRYRLRTTPPRTRQQPHPLNSWFDAVDWPRSPLFFGG